jgi:hypothetical protein
VQGKPHEWIYHSDVLAPPERLRRAALELALEVAVAAKRCGSMSTPTAHDRAAATTDAIIKLIFSSPRNLRSQIEALLRDQFHDMQSTLDDICREDG